MYTKLSSSPVTTQAHRSPIGVRRGLRDHERPIAARIYFDAFRAKLTPLLGAAATALPIIERSLEPAAALVATRDRQVVGIIGLHHGQRQLVQWRWATLRAAFGWLQGTGRYGLSLLFTRTPRPGELLLDGIAVAEAARGQGVGTQLLNEAASFGREHGYRAICLDVVNTNPGARRLYERAGFAPIVTRSYPFLRPFGFTEVTTMLQIIA